MFIVCYIHLGLMKILCFMIKIDDLGYISYTDKCDKGSDDDDGDDDDLVKFQISLALL